MGKIDSIPANVKNHDWQRAIKAGAEMAAEATRSDVTVKEEHVIWALLREAATVSKNAYKGPPKTGYPGKSSMPESVDDVTQWQLISAYLRGEVEEMPANSNTRVQPTAEQISRAEIILWVWHTYALAHKGDKSRLKRAVYLKAAGVPDRKVRAVTGITKQAIHAAKHEAMRDMWCMIRTC